MSQSKAVYYNFWRIFNVIGLSKENCTNNFRPEYLTNFDYPFQIQKPQLAAAGAGLPSPDTDLTVAEGRHQQQHSGQEPHALQVGQYRTRGNTGLVAQRRSNVRRLQTAGEENSPSESTAEFVQPGVGPPSAQVGKIQEETLPAPVRSATGDAVFVRRRNFPYGNGMFAEVGSLRINGINGLIFFCFQLKRFRHNRFSQPQKEFRRRI